jgi:hypothetical protein
MLQLSVLLEKTLGNVKGANQRSYEDSGAISLHTHVSCGVIAMLCWTVRCALKIGKLYFK